MSEHDAVLTIVGGGQALPESSRTVEEWRIQAEACIGNAEITPYRGMTALLFGEVGISVSEHMDKIRLCKGSTEGLSFRDARNTTQAQLADAAAANLFDGPEGANDRKQCRLTIFATSSIDENFFQSTVSRIASEYGLSRAPHFALGQLDGASIIAAIEVVDGMIEGEDLDATATLIAAEKWPLPYPRLLPLWAVLGDGAAALSLSRDPSRAGLRVLGTLVESHDPFVEPGGDWANLNACLSAEVAATSKRLLVRLGVDVATLTGCIPSGMCRALDCEILTLLGVSCDFIEVLDVHDGYLGAATAPLLLASLLQRFQAGELAAGATCLLWACSFGGAVAAMVVQTHEGSRAI